MEEIILQENEINEVNELNEQFKEFLKTKGIKAKFKLAFSNMKDSTKKQHEIDKANFKSVKEKSIEDNREFYEFLHTKGFKAKVKLVIANIKKGAKEAKTKDYRKPNIPTVVYNTNIHTVDINKEFELFLKAKGLDKKYTVTIEEIKR